MSLLNPWTSVYTNTKVTGDPFEEFDDIFDRTISGSLGRDVSTIFGSATEETENEFLLNIDLPGVKEEDISLSLEENMLNVIGERKQKSENSKIYKGKNYYGVFNKSVYLPKNTDVENISAELENGVLTVTVPKMKKKESSSKKIPISSKK